MTSRTRSLLAASFVAALFSVAAAAQGGAQTRPSGPAADYIVGAQDVLTITCYDQADLSGKFTVETDGTFSYPLIGRNVPAGGEELIESDKGGEVERRVVEGKHHDAATLHMVIDEGALGHDQTLSDVLAASGRNRVTISEHVLCCDARSLLMAQNGHIETTRPCLLLDAQWTLTSCRLEQLVEIDLSL